MLSSYPLWWLALPVLLLPVWWHRQKRQRLKAEPLATARFLPSAAPEQLRVWQWRDRLLLLVRCLMLVALIAWLAATIFPWRGDTVLLDAGADKAWAEQQIAAAGMGAAQRSELPANGLRWLRQHERDWRPGARLLIVSRADQLAMPARVPQFSHLVELRIKPPAAAATAATPAGHHIVLAGAQEPGAAWRSLFAAFNRAGDGASRYVLTAEPDAKTELIVWESAAAPPSHWRAPHWWVAAPAAFPELTDGASPAVVPAQAGTHTSRGQSRSMDSRVRGNDEVTIRGTPNDITLKYTDTPRGRLWTSAAFPPRDADTARALHEAWRQLSPAPAPPYPMPSQALSAARSALPAITDARPAAWLALALLALFLLERILTHARRN